MRSTDPLVSQSPFILNTFTAMDKKDCLLVGNVSRLHGYKGELSLKLDHELPFDYEELEMIMLELNNKLVPHFITGMRMTPKGYALTFFEGVDTESHAKRLVGTDLFIPREQLPEMDDDSYFTHELLGFKVIDANYGDVGEITEVVEHPGNTLLRIEREDGEVLIPLIDQFVKEVNKTEQCIYVTTPEGLIDVNLEGLGE